MFKMNIQKHRDFLKSQEIPKDWYTECKNQNQYVRFCWFIFVSNFSPVLNTRQRFFFFFFLSYKISSSFVLEEISRDLNLLIPIWVHPSSCVRVAGSCSCYDPSFTMKLPSLFSFSLSGLLQY